MDRSVRFAVVCVGVSLLVSCHSAEAWYKQSTGPIFYPVGRASGLLSGIRRSPYVRRAESEEVLADSKEAAENSVTHDASRQISALKDMVSPAERAATSERRAAEQAVKPRVRKGAQSSGETVEIQVLAVCADHISTSV